MPAPNSLKEYLIQTGGITAAEIALGAALYKEEVKEAISALVALSQLTRGTKSRRHKNLVGISGVGQNLTSQGISPEPQPISEPEAESEPQPEEEGPAEEEAAAEEETTEEGAEAPEEGTKETPPATGENKPEKETEKTAAPPAELPNEIPEEEQGQMARDLKKDQQEGSRQGKVEDQPDTAPELKEQTPTEDEQPTRRDLAGQQKEERKQAKARAKAEVAEAKARAKKKKENEAGRIPFIEKGVEDIEILVEKSGAIKGTEDYWWVCIDNLELIFEGEFITPIWAFIYIHVHAMGQFLGLTFFQKFGRPLVNYFILLLLDLLLLSQFLIQAVIILAIVYLAKHPWKLIAIGYVDLITTFLPLIRFFYGNDAEL